MKDFIEKAVGPNNWWNLFGKMFFVPANTVKTWHHKSDCKPHQRLLFAYYLGWIHY